jgi:DNA-binding MarR family transcriptional regulator
MEPYKNLIDKALRKDPKKLILKRLKEKKVNPFIPNLEFKFDLFVNREEIIKKIIYEIALGKHDLYKKNIFITGQTGTGKTYLLKYLHELLEKLSQEGNKYFFKKEIFDVNRLYETPDNDNEESPMRYVSYKNKNFNVVIFHSGSGKQISDLIGKFKNTIIKIFEISPLDWKKNSVDLKNRSELFELIKLENLSNKSIIEIIEKRLDFHNIDKNVQNDLISDVVLDFTINFCFNNIKLILYIFAEAFNLIVKENVNKITKKKIHDILKSKKIRFLRKDYLNLSSIKKEILKELYLNKSLNSKRMANNLDRNWTNISGYMKRLSERGYLKREKIGKKVKYDLNKIILPIIDNEILKEI